MRNTLLYRHHRDRHNYRLHQKCNKRFEKVHDIYLKIFKTNSRGKKLEKKRVLQKVFFEKLILIKENLEENEKIETQP